MADLQPPYERYYGPGAEVLEELGEADVRAFYNQFEPQEVGDMRLNLGPQTEETKRVAIDDLVKALGKVMYAAAVVQRAEDGTATILNISAVDANNELSSATASAFQHHGYALIGCTTAIEYARMHGVERVKARIRGKRKDATGLLAAANRHGLRASLAYSE